MMPRRDSLVAESLVRSREKTGLSLSQIAESTKIGTRYLEAIERADFAKLPGGVYTISYVRQYARAVEYDEDELVAYYRDAIGPEPAETVEPPRPDPGMWRLRYYLHWLLG